MKLYANFLSLLLLFFSISSIAQKSFNLEEAVLYALDHNSSIKEAQINISDAEGVIIENTSIGIPQLKFGADYTFNTQLPSTVIPAQFFDPSSPEGEFIDVVFGLKQNFNAGITLDWLALDGTYIYGLKAAKEFRKMREEEYQATQKKVRADVTDAYLPALIIHENLKILEKNIANADQLFREIDAMYKEGFVERQDVLQIQLSQVNLRNEKENLERQKEKAIAYLKFVINYPEDQTLDISDSVESLFIEASPSELTDKIEYTSRPEYAAAQTGIRLNEINIKRYKSGYLPSLRVIGAYQRTWQGDAFGEGFWFPSSFVGANLSVPLFDGFLKKGNIQRARLEKELAELRLRDLEKAISLDVQNARRDYKNAQKSLQNNERALELAKVIYDSATIKYKEGVGSSLELNQTEQSYYTAQRNHIQALYNLLTAKKALEKAMGY